MSKHIYVLQKKYEGPSIQLLGVYLEESLCSSSASIVIGDPDEVYQPSVEDWGQGSVSNDTYEF